MVRRTVGILALLSATSGCSTTMSMSVPAPPGDPVVAYVNQTGSERSGLVRTRQASLLAPRLAITDASLLVRGGDQTTGTILLSDVRSIDFRDRSRGALEGALVGVGVATALGLLTFIDDDGSNLFGSRRDAFFLVTAISSLGTVPAGAILGALIGHRTTIHLEPARRSHTLNPTKPPDGPPAPLWDRRRF